MLKPVDILVLAALLRSDLPDDWTQEQLARKLQISQSNVHRALKQLERSGLLRDKEPQRQAARELFVHGVRYVYPPELGAPARGVPTAHAGPALANRLVSEAPWVWPLEGGPTYGTTLLPLHSAVPSVALLDPSFHELLSLVDVFRVGRARECLVAQARLAELLR